ncbi:DEAD/DEAH box helicase family protein [Tritrichomonas foetus]|uniref:RNA helicase n=1 Tax=Tritrichomonas foetus TaxID=1144522 RepID=A0A1J4J691_9EUKA|nr:DEAD/DEAH box helicase family protein [Tritrichomonas foetus]|eukprot:OHS94712.1 DEAD/DEAH box helicase family protein [Tritrichomonas foetus]
MESSTTWDSILKSEARVLDAAKKLWPTPTVIQQKAIPAAMEGKDILARAQTGSGKTATYIIPILAGILRSPLPWTYKALVLVPSRELCKQVKSQFDDLARYCHITVTHLGDDVSVASQKLALAANPPAILIGTPTRITALSSNFYDNVAYFVIDEADQQLGLDHGPDIETIISKLPATRQSFLMSATLGDEIEHLQSLVLNNPLRLDVVESTRASLLSHFYVIISEEHSYEVLMHLLKNNSVGRRILLFVNSTSRGYKIRLFLERFGIKSSVLNAQLPVASRIHILNEFNRGSIDVLVAIDEGDDDVLSNEFSVARGIDFQNLDAVINFDIPKTLEQYVHRVGRTARAMREGTALTFIPNLASFSEISTQLKETEGTDVAPLDFNVHDAEIIRYRVQSVLASITKKQIRESKKIDIKREIMNSEKLKAHFEENPADLQMLKHDQSLMPQRVDKSLRYLPDYLGNQVKRMQHPLTQKARQQKMDSNKTKNHLAKLDSINEAIKRRKKHSHNNQKHHKH